MKIKPCPFCGNENIHVGPHSCMSHEIKCVFYILDDDHNLSKIGGCGAMIVERYPERLPRGYTHRTLKHWLKKKLIARWNKRA